MPQTQKEVHQVCRKATSHPRSSSETDDCRRIHVHWVLVVPPLKRVQMRGDACLFVHLAHVVPPFKGLLEPALSKIIGQKGLKRPQSCLDPSCDTFFDIHPSPASGRQAPKSYIDSHPCHTQTVTTIILKQAPQSHTHTVTRIIHRQPLMSCTDSHHKKTEACTTITYGQSPQSHTDSHPTHTICKPAPQAADRCISPLQRSHPPHVFVSCDRTCSFSDANLCPQRSSTIMLRLPYALVPGNMTLSPSHFCVCKDHAHPPLHFSVTACTYLSASSASMHARTSCE